MTVYTIYKDKSCFVKFDIVKFYSSLLEELPGITTISHLVISITKHTRKSLLFDKSSACVKKGKNSLFDVTMGSYDGAKICKLIGLNLNR